MQSFLFKFGLNDAIIRSACATLRRTTMGRQVSKTVQYKFITYTETPRKPVILQRFSNVEVIPTT